MILYVTVSENEDKENEVCDNDNIDEDDISDVEESKTKSKISNYFLIKLVLCILIILSKKIP